MPPFGTIGSFIVGSSPLFVQRIVTPGVASAIVMRCSGAYAPPSGENVGVATFGVKIAVATALVLQSGWNADARKT